MTSQDHATAENAVIVKDLEKRFGDFVAVNHITFEVRRGEIFGFLGPNGAGKSTTIRMLCGILAPTSGQGWVAGFDLHTQTEAIKSHIGYMSQRFSLYEDLTVEENIDFYGGIYRIPTDRKRERKEWAIEMAGLRDHRRTLTRELSGGWKQRLALGCAILHEPPILFLDEPTSGVDPISRRSFWELIYEMAGRGVTVFVTTHYMDEAEYCDRVALIYRGELIALDTPTALKSEITREQILEIECERPQDALALLDGASGIRESALFGKGLHVVTSEVDTATASVRDTLKKHNLALTRIEQIAPSLEDVFVLLIEERERQQRTIGEVRT